MRTLPTDHPIRWIQTVQSGHSVSFSFHQGVERGRGRGELLWDTGGLFNYKCQWAAFWLVRWWESSWLAVQLKRKNRVMICTCSSRFVVVTSGSHSSIGNVCVCLPLRLWKLTTENIPAQMWSTLPPHTSTLAKTFLYIQNISTATQLSHMQKIFL